MKQVVCRDCGKSRDLEWKQGKAGRWYLADVFHGARGSTYTLPHFKSCPVANAERNAKILADEKARQTEMRAHMVWTGTEYIDNRTGQPWQS